MKKTILAATLSLLSVSTIFAVPAKPGVRTYTQPDGSVVLIEKIGDEHFHYTTTTDGYLVNKIDGRYEYAELKSDGTIMSTGIMAQNQEIRSADVVNRLAFIGKFEPSAKFLADRRANAPRIMKAQPQKATTFGNKGLVILIEYKDVKFSRTREEFVNLLNKENYSDFGATGSAKDYFKVASNGAYNPEFDVFGPYTLDNDMRYYGANDLGGNDLKPEQMVVDALNKLADDPDVSVNFADYDADNDGQLDNVFIYYAGYGENQSHNDDTIWPHRFVVRENRVQDYRKYDGKVVYDYACACELKNDAGTDICGVGTFCHEFSHVLGLPDLYVTDYSSNHKTHGRWDLMDMGSYNNDEDTPAGYSAGERIFVGWLTPELLNETKDITIEELQASNKAYVVTKTGSFNFNPTAPIPDEYYILENRQLTGWDAYLPGHGMMITKTKYNEYRWTMNTVNNSPYTMGVDIIEADGVASIDKNGKAGDLFPGSANVTSYTFDKYSSISDIKENNGVITLKFQVSDIARPHIVVFDAGAHGKCYVESRTEKEGGAGIRLPNVEPEKGWYFLGWATTADATSADAGRNNETYYPKDDITLYAVYSQNIVPTGITPIDEIMLITANNGQSTLINIPLGAHIRCVDLTGRTLWNHDAETESIDIPDFSTPTVIVVSYDNYVRRLKNI